MKKIQFKYVILILFVTLISSCLNMNIDEEPAPTAENEQRELTAYLDRIQQSGNDIDTTDLGIYYVTMEEGEGEFPKSGDSLVVGYAGYFIDGGLFDSSDKYNDEGTIGFILENPPMIKGWDDGMKVINKDAKVQLIIPSEFAYGSEGSGTIPPYSTLIFVVKMMEINPSDEL